MIVRMEWKASTDPITPLLLKVELGLVMISHEADLVVRLVSLAKNIK